MHERAQTQTPALTVTLAILFICKGIAECFDFRPVRFDLVRDTLHQLDHNLTQVSTCLTETAMSWLLRLRPQINSCIYAKVSSVGHSVSNARQIRDRRCGFQLSTSNYRGPFGIK